MKNSIIISISTFLLLLSACSKNTPSSGSTGRLYVIVNSGSHFTGQSYVNTVNATSGSTAYYLAQGQVYAVGGVSSSIDTVDVGQGSPVTARSYTLTVQSYRTSGGSAVPPVYNGTANCTLSAGQTLYVNVSTN